MTRTQEAFLDLLRCGLWGTPLNPSIFGEEESSGDNVNSANFGKASLLSHQEWKDIVDLATVQTVTGVVLDALQTLPKALRPPKDIYFNLVAQVGDLEDGGYQMNKAIAYLFHAFDKAGIEVFLLKGQAVAQFYPQPLHRVHGDIDLLVPDAQNFERAIALMQSLTGEEGEPEDERSHVVFSLKGVCVEVQGLNVYGIGRRCFQHYIDWAKESLKGESRKLILQTDRQPNDDAQSPKTATLSPMRFDLMFVFVHLMNHFFDGGVGLRQVCDWMRYLHENRSTIDLSQLEKDLHTLGLMPHWQTIASTAVCWLGAPKESIPFYSPSFDKKGRIALNHILRSGNFGMLRTNVFEEKNSHLMRRFGTLLSLFPSYGRVARLFPADACFSFYRYAKRRL
ncbi:MAG: nucleotidyltransferase family protein [Prevotella sp.]|nr:nucleotidyltransferase family protein [Prevotella sp.]